MRGLRNKRAHWVECWWLNVEGYRRRPRTERTYQTYHADARPSRCGPGDPRCLIDDRILLGCFLAAVEAGFRLRAASLTVGNLFRPTGDGEARGRVFC